MFSKVLLSTFVAGALAAEPQVRESVANEYIVVLKGDLSAKARAAHMTELGQTFRSTGMRMVAEYDIGANADRFQAYTVSGLDDAMVSEIASSGDVAYVQPNYVDHIDACQEDSHGTDIGLWGLRRTISRTVTSNPNYRWNDEQCGAGVELYILDTGINVDHEDYEGRAEWIGDYTTNPVNDCSSRPCVDGNGHGTHVASSAGGSLYGLARCSPIKALAVCTPAGSCPSSAQLGAIAKVGEDAAAGKKIVANMSLGGFGTNQATLDAIRAASGNGAVFVVASGNSSDDACRYSPAQSEHALTVNSIQRSTNSATNARSGFSNYGACTDIFAPGSNVKAAWIGSTTVTRTISGTSMASPHAAGAAAIDWSANPSLDQAQLRTYMVNKASTGQVTNAGNGSPDALLYLEDCRE